MRATLTIEDKETLTIEEIQDGIDYINKKLKKGERIKFLLPYKLDVTLVNDDKNIKQMQSSLKDNEVGAMIIQQHPYWWHIIPIFVTNKKVLCGEDLHTPLQRDGYNCSTLAIELAKIMIKNEEEVYKIINSDNFKGLDSFPKDIKNQITKYSQDFSLLSEENWQHLEKKNLIGKSHKGKDLNLILAKKHGKIRQDSLNIEILNAIKDDDIVAQQIFNSREEGDMKKYKQEWKNFVQQQKEELKYYNSQR